MIQTFKDAVNFLAAPTVSFTLMVFGLLVAIYIRPIWSKVGGIVMMVAGVAFFAFSLTDENFRLIVTKPDNVPIAIMIFLVGFFTWYSLHQGHENDRRIAAGEPIIEREGRGDEKVFVWPDLVYIEMLLMIVLTAVLVIWAIYLKAPIEEAANPSIAPNPSKAPWYFLGLQEMLVYFDPWLAGVVLPTLIIVGLMAIPFIDTNPKGSGYYTFKERHWEILVFFFGFHVLWIFLVVTGTFLRGPNWNFFGPYEYWDPTMLEPLNNVNLSEYIWVRWTGIGLPGNPLLRESGGILFVIAYFTLVPLLLSQRLFKRFYVKMGPARFWTGAMLFMTMMLLPMKMFFRWTMNMKYLIAFPEYFFNI